MAKRTKNPITLDEIIDAFIFSEPTLKMEDIKVYSPEIGGLQKSG